MAKDLIPTVIIGTKKNSKMKSLRIHYLQHVAFEGLGYIETWANENNHILTATKFYEDFVLPEIADFDWLIVMGGPMGVYDELEFSWLEEEKLFIKKNLIFTLFTRF